MGVADELRRLADAVSSSDEDPAVDAARSILRDRHFRDDTLRSWWLEYDRRTRIGRALEAAGLGERGRLWCRCAEQRNALHEVFPAMTLRSFWT